MTESAAALSTSPRLRGEVGSRSDPGEGATRLPNRTEEAPHPNPLPVNGERGKRRHAQCIALLAVLLICVLLSAAAWWIVSLGRAPDGKDLQFSPRVTDRNGRLLRAYTTNDGRWRLPARIADVDPRFFELLFAYEDRRFREHHGVDALALVRAAIQFVGSGRIRSGGSTLTMQVARLLEPRNGRTLAAKLHQIVRAVEIERTLTKDQIVSLYLELAPYGGNIEGIRAASLAYFGKEPRRLTLGEAALLVALPQSPEARRPDRSAEAARAARDRVLDRFAALSHAPADEILAAKAEAVPSGRRPMPMLAPHAADRAIAQSGQGGEVRLTIDADLQRSLEELARERARGLALALGPDVSLAMLVIDNKDGAVVARVGSPDYFDARRAGQVDLTRTLRSPGSTLKPLIYGLGFEDGFIHPETLIDDRPTRYGPYAPQNFDFTFHGTVTVRTALQLSLNLPALAVLDRVGASRLTSRLANAGAALILPEGETPGLAIGLGGAGITLSDLVMLYSGIARLGAALPVAEQVSAASSPSAGEERRLMEPVAAWYVANILICTPPPDNGAPGRIAFKTGTSYGYRDAWSIGFDGSHTIGVWVGRPDGAPVPGLIGRNAAAPILFDAFARLPTPTTALPRPPAGILMTTSAKLPPPLKHFAASGRLGESGAGLHILFPPDGARIELAEGNAGPAPVRLKLTGGTLPLTILVNGNPALSPARQNLFFQPQGPGFARVTVIDASGAVDSVSVRLEDAKEAAISPTLVATPLLSRTPAPR
jgi:penicillin-binding protein 1C